MRFRGVQKAQETAKTPVRPRFNISERTMGHIYEQRYRARLAPGLGFGQILTESAPLPMMHAQLQAGDSPQ